MSAPAYGVLTDDVGEISGFGGAYEQCCRALLQRGCEWLLEHPDVELQFSEIKGVYGLVFPEAPHGEDLIQVLTVAAEPLGGLTGAMLHAVISHLVVIKRRGWEAYLELMRARERAS